MESLHALMHVIDKNKHTMQDNDYIVACSHIKSLYQDVKEARDAISAQGTAVKYISRHLEGSSERSVSFESLSLLDDFIFETKLSMEMESMHKRYKADLEKWHKTKDAHIPLSYEEECVALYYIDNAISISTNQPFSINSLRQLGKLIDVSDESFLCDHFVQLDRWYIKNQKADKLNSSGAWNRFTSTECSCDLLDLIEESHKAISWKKTEQPFQL